MTTLGSSGERDRGEVANDGPAQSSPLMSFRHRIYGETQTGWKVVLVETDGAFDDLMICGPGGVRILIVAFDPSQSDHEVPHNPYLGQTTPLAQAAYQDKLAVESFVKQGRRYHLLQVGNAFWTLDDEDARLFYALLEHAR